MAYFMHSCMCAQGAGLRGAGTGGPLEQEGRLTRAGESPLWEDEGVISDHSLSLQ